MLFSRLASILEARLYLFVLHTCCKSGSAESTEARAWPSTNGYHQRTARPQTAKNHGRTAARAPFSLTIPPSLENRDGYIIIFVFFFIFSYFPLTAGCAAQQRVCFNVKCTLEGGNDLAISYQSHLKHLEGIRNTAGRRILVGRCSELRD